MKSRVVPRNESPLLGFPLFFATSLAVEERTTSAPTGRMIRLLPRLVVVETKDVVMPVTAPFPIVGFHRLCKNASVWVHRKRYARTDLIDSRFVLLDEVILYPLLLICVVVDGRARSVTYP
jgi:hypothetical protein